MELIMLSVPGVSSSGILSTVCQVSNATAMNPLQFVAQLELNDREDMGDLYTDRNTTYSLLSTEVEIDSNSAIYPPELVVDDKVEVVAGWLQLYVQERNEKATRSY